MVCIYPYHVSLKHSSREGEGGTDNIKTDIATYRVNQPRGLFSENLQYTNENGLTAHFMQVQFFLTSSWEDAQVLSHQTDVLLLRPPKS